MLYDPRWAVRPSGLIVPHYTRARWNAKRWPNFSPFELSCTNTVNKKRIPCRHCGGEYYDWPEFNDRLQYARTKLGVPVRLNSAHRCIRHNIEVGGAPLSQHKKLAADISLRGHNRHEVLAACRAAGFKGFGFYNTFLHVDLGRPRFWFGGKLAKEAWKNAT